MQRPNPELGTQTKTTIDRILAWLVDSVVLGVATILFAIIISWIIKDSFSITILFWLFGSFVYRIALEAMYGQTLGKKALKIVVIKENGDPCSWGAAMIRNFLRIVDSIFFYLVGLIVILVSDDNQRVGDIAADTLVTEVADVPPPPPDDFIVELHEDAANGERYVELINQTGHEVDLSRATLRTTSGDEFRFPQGEAVHNAGDSKTFLIPEDFMIVSNTPVTLLTNNNERFGVRWRES